MKEKDILVSLDMAEDKYIEEASPENEKVKKKIKIKTLQNEIS